MLRRLGGSLLSQSQSALHDVQAELLRRLASSAAQSSGAAPRRSFSAGSEAEEGEGGHPQSQADDPTVVAKRKRMYTYAPPSGSWSVAISNAPRTALREDILHFLPPLGLTVEDIRPSFDSNLRVVDFWVSFGHQSRQQAALACDGRLLGQRRVRVTAVSRDEVVRALETRWVGYSRGRYLLITGLDRKVSLIDIMHAFNRFQLMPIAVNLFESWGDQPGQEDKQAAVIRLASAEEAWHALRNCNHCFVRDERINLRVLP